MSEFIITFRETLEAALIVWIICTFLVKHGYISMLKQVARWIAAALIASLIFARWLREIQEIVWSTAYEKLFESVMMFTTAWILLYMVVWMSKWHYKMYTLPTNTTSNDPNCLWCDLNKQSDSLKPWTKKTIKQAILSATTWTIGKNETWGIFWLIFFAILREWFETALFLYSSISLTWSFSHLWFWWWIIIASIIWYILFVAWKRISLQKFFTVSSVMLIIFAAGMATYGTHELEEFFVKQGYIEKASITRVWNILEPQSEISPALQDVWTYNDSKKQRFHPLHDKGTYWVFLKWFFWYNSDPNIAEPIVWLFVLLLGFWLRWRTRKI